MNHLLDSDVEQDEAEYGGEREISLGPGTILAIFFGLALLCGAVFGLGYSMGRRSAQNAAAAVIIPNGSPAVTSANKPTAGSAIPPAPLGTPTTDEIPSVPAGKATRADAAIVGDVIPKTPTAQPAPAAPLKPVVTTAAGSPPAAVPPIAPGGSFMVQVAAVSTQEIADIELAALRKFNYAVVVRHEPSDQLLHIQIGPFATRKDAEAMRQNVLSHGFNAIVK